MSENGRNNVTARFEGRVSWAYDDAQGKYPVIHSASQVKGTLTIGIGHTKGVYPGQTATDQEIEAWFVQDTLQACYDVQNLVKVPITQNQADALIDFQFNTGGLRVKDKQTGKMRDSTLLQKLNSGDYQGAADQFLAWTKVNGVVIQGLVNRANARRDLFLEGMGVLSYVYNGSGTSKGLSTGAKIGLGAIALAVLNGLS
jgi:lysozyme